MSVNPIENNPTPKTTGSLEELFRHHLGEEAAVPPRPMLWDQIDNSLLIRQNEIYRKRLVVTRWVAAASLLLATLAGTGWWTRRDASLGGTDVAAVSQPAGTRPGTGARMAGSAAALPSPTQLATSRPGTSSAAGDKATGAMRSAAGSNAASAGIAAQAADHTTTVASVSALHSPAAQQYLGAKSTATQPYTGHAARNAATGAGAGTASGMALAARGSQAAPSEAGGADFGGANLTSRREPATPGNTVSTNEAMPATVALGGAGSAAAVPGAATETTVAGSGTAVASVPSIAVSPVDLLATNPTALNMTAPATLPNGLTAPALAEEAPADIDAHRWHYGASYAASVFNPNIDFSRAGIESKYDYNHAPGFGAQSPALTEAAAAQYREHLRPGLSQRIALLASRHLAGHWSLRTGAEFSQSTAQSATALAFVGEQLPDVGQSLAGPLQPTTFRYRMASIPVEIRYDNPVKRGWSIYGRLGGVVSALLGVRSDVVGNPEATRTYSITSDGMPYRRMMASVRGGAGAQFRTATGKWAFTAGPVAELGLVSMNAHPVQGYFAQSRPYSFGLEAGMEFGR